MLLEWAYNVAIRLLFFNIMINILMEAIMEVLKGLVVFLLLISGTIAVISLFVVIWVNSLELTWLWVKIGITSTVIAALCVLFIKLASQ